GGDSHPLIYMPLTLTGFAVIQNGTTGAVIDSYQVDVNVTANATGNATVGIAAQVSLNASDFSVPAINSSNSDADEGIKYLNITNTTSLENVTMIRIVFYYADFELSGLDEKTISFYYWDSNTSTWLNAMKYVGKNLTPSGPTVYDAGRNTAENYVYIVVDHFSIYGLGASVYGGGGSVYGGGGHVAPQIVPRTGIVRITRPMYVGLVRQFNYFDRRFYNAPQPLWGTLASIGAYWAPVEQAEDLNPITHPHDIEDLLGDVYRIASQAVLEEKPGGAGTVIISRGDLGVDSIAATAYAEVHHMPILLVEPASIPAETADALQRLGARSTVIIGGHEAVSEELVPQLPNATRIWGADRYWTAVRLAEELTKEVHVDTVVVTDGLDPEGTAVMVASYYDAPIVYVKGDEVPEPTRQFLQTHSFKKVILVEVSDTAAEEIKSII
ncbi:MAG: cell wall-binding repeat-containing protein, partial [Methanobacteriota archaeon]